MIAKYEIKTPCLFVDGKCWFIGVDLTSPTIIKMIEENYYLHYELKHLTDKEIDML